MSIICNMQYVIYVYNDYNSGTKLAASSSKCHPIFDDVDNDDENNDDDYDEFSSPISCHSAAPQFADEC